MRRAPRAGYILLLVLVVVLVLALIAVASVTLGGAERQSELFGHDQAMAQSMAETGLVRSHVYLSTLLETDVDLDRALDPGLDTTCAPGADGLQLGGNQLDDHLPPFSDGLPVTAGLARRSWTMVRYSGADGGIVAGGYLVRIDDNADDADPSLPRLVTGNNACPENTWLWDAGQNPVRDRDRTVEVTSVGFYPGGAIERARAVRAVKATFAPGNTGIAANGTVSMGGGTSVCGPWGGIVATGDILDVCLCGAGCPGHTRCLEDDVCEARAGGPVCRSSPQGGGGSCRANEEVPGIPRVSPWDRLNAPAMCAGPGCEPFWYLRATGDVAELFQWNYAGTALDSADGGCRDPQHFPRICHPGDSGGACAGASCWVLQQTSADGGAGDILLRDGLRSSAAPPPRIPRDPSVPVAWHLAGGGFVSAPGCGGPLPSPAYPWPTSSGRGLGWSDAQRTEFEVAADDVLPRGTWFVEGTVLWRRAPSPPCGALPWGWRLTLLAAGDVQFERSAALRPSAPRGVSVVTGRDLVLTSGAEVSSCGEPAAFLAHEQVSIGASETLEGQLIADDRGNCSPRASGRAILVFGGGVVRVPSFPPVPLPRDLMRVRSSPVPW